MKNLSKFQGLKLTFFALIPSLFLACTPAKHVDRPTEKVPITNYVEEKGKRIKTMPTTYEPLAHIGNAHALTKHESIIRGATPRGKASHLRKAGVTDVLIFRYTDSNEVLEEITELKTEGFKSENIFHIPMEWKDIKDRVAACQKVIAAIQVMSRFHDKPGFFERPKRLYVHCTVGEDRTGMLVGLYRMVFNNWSLEKAYQNELCKHGFAEGSPTKPKFVIDGVNQNLKPLFLQMAAKVESGQLSKGNLDPSICDSLEKPNLASLNQSLTCGR
jgi:hypothetical protein